MLVSLDEVKTYIRVDSEAEDTLLLSFINTAETLCQDILRIPFTTLGQTNAPVHLAVLYGVSYLYEFREQADFKELTLTLRNLLFAQREEVF